MQEQLHEHIREMRGCIEVAMYKAKTGEEIWSDQRRLNAIAIAGRRWNLDHMLSGQGATSQVLSDMGIGTDITAPTTGDTGLGSEFFRKAVGTWDTSGLTADPPFIRALIQFNTDEGNTTLAEAALFNSNAAGTMMAHATFATTDKTTDNTFGITYTISN